MSTHTVLIFDDRFDSYEEERSVLSEIDAEVVILREPAVKSDPEVLAAAEAVLVNLLPMDSANIAVLGPMCRVISRYGVGMDNVDVDAATAKGIWCANIRGYASEDVSDHALALLMGCIRSVTRRDRKIREGKWNTANAISARRVSGKTLGVVGLGSIGRALVRKVSGLGLAEILVSDPYESEEAIHRAGARRVSLEQLLSASDYITIHAPLTDETRGIIGQPEFAAMKPEAILINTSRGPLVDETALAEALRDRIITAAGIDVYDTEPLSESSPLRKLDNIVLTDHVGWYSQESIVELKTGCAANAREVLRGNPPIYPVNQVL